MKQRRQYPASMFRQHGHANFLSALFKSAAPSAKPSADNNTFGGKPIPEGFKLKADKTGLDVADGYELDPADKNKARKKSQDNPLDIFSGLFQNDPSKPSDTAPAFSLDPEALKKVTEGLNFAGQLTPETLEKLKSGDPETVSGVLNSLGRNVYGTLMQHMPALTDKFVGARLEHDRKGLGREVKSTLTQQSLETLAAGNPVLKQQMEVISSQLLEKFPDATPDWISGKTKEYFVELAKVLDPTLKATPEDKTKPKSSSDLSQNPDFEWAKYLTQQPPAQ